MPLPRRQPISRPHRRSAPLAAPFPRRQRGNLQTSNLGLAPVRFNGPSDPRQIRSLPSFSQYLQAVITHTSGTSTSVTCNDLTPSSFASTYRFERVSVYAPSVSAASPVDSALSVTEPVSGCRFADAGTAGSSRASVHFVFPFSVRQEWLVSDSSDLIFTIDASSTTGTYVIQFLSEFRMT